MPRTAVVTDSTARPVPGGVGVVDLDVVVDGEAVGEDGTSTAAVLAAMAAGRAVGTSRPSPDGFARAYADAAAAGASAAVSVHLSGALSGTVEAARLAAGGATLRVEVVDTGAVGAVLSAAVRAASALADDGADARRVAAAARAVADASTTWVSPASAGHLQRGGRGTGVAGLPARTGLSARSLLVVRDGRLLPLERARTTARVLDRLRDVVRERVEEVLRDPTLELLAVVVQHAGAEDAAERLVDRLAPLLAGGTGAGRASVPAATTGATVQPLSPVLAAHVGPGTVGVAVVAGPRVPSPARSRPSTASPGG